MKSTGGIPARPTTYKGVRMRSRLEAGFAMWLDQQRWTWAYEPECFANEHGQWLPDFRLDIPCVTHTDDGVRWGFPTYVEVKPVSFGLGLERNAGRKVEADELATRMSTTFATHPDAGLVLAQEGTNPIAISPSGEQAPVDWTWTGLWPIDARRVGGPWQREWWKDVAA